jgi:hypothetical protein
MNKIKIVHVITSLTVGGAQQLLLDLLKNSPPQYDITVIELYSGELKKELREENIKVITLNLKTIFSSIKVFIDLLKTIKKINPDIIHNHFDFLPLSYSRLIKTPMLTTIHGFSSSKILPVYKKYNASTSLSPRA